MSYARSAHATFLNMLGTLDHLAEKAIAAGMTDEVLHQKLTDDMFPLELQFRVAINQLLLALNQVAGQTVALDEATCRSLVEVRERIAAARNLIESTDPDDWHAADTPIDLTLPNGVRFVMTAEQDIRDWLLPNFYFHVTMSYALLRAAGLPVGKLDFLRHMERYLVSPSP